MEETLNSIDGGNNDDALNDITESLMQAESPQPAKRISKPWFDRDCYIERNLVLEKPNELRKTNARDDYLRLAYANARARYKSLLKAKKLQYTHIKEEESMRGAEMKPYRALDPRRIKTTPSIPMSIWESHFTRAEEELVLPHRRTFSPNQK